MADEYADEDLDQGQDPEVEEPDPVEEPVEGDSVPRAQYDKVVKEARTLRGKYRRAELAQEYGKEVLELVPPSLPLKDQQELAAKLSERLGQPASTRLEQGTELTAEPAVEQPTEQERRAAALVQSGSGQPATTAITDVQQAAELAFGDPAAYERMKRAGLIQLAKLPGAER